MVANVIDTFCGVGGLTNGFIQEGFSVLAGLDSDGSCRYAYEQNNHATFIECPIEQADPVSIAALYPDGAVKILVGCAPCQPFSRYAQKAQHDEKWKLLDVFAKFILDIQPDIISMENVPDLLDHHGGKVYRAFVQALKRRYYTKRYIVHCPDYGIPQNRDRLVFFASRFGPIHLAPATHSKATYRTVRQTISHLPSIAAGESDVEDALHRSASLSPTNLQRIRQSSPGGTWRDWDRELRAECHQRATGSTYPSVYGRMEWDMPAPTITTQCYGYGSGRFGHPEQDRALSLREAALLQTFPPEYVFTAPDAPIHLRVVGRHIGNAVPVDLGRVIARSIDQHLHAQVALGRLQR